MSDRTMLAVGRSTFSVSRLTKRAVQTLAATALTAAHEDGSVVARGCDDQAEFEFALDLLLDGFTRLRELGWRAPPSTG